MKNEESPVDDYEQLSLHQLYAALGTDQNGLRQEEAERRLQNYGANELNEQKASSLLKFLRYFWGPIPWMIEAAAILSGIVHRWPDFIIITILLATNAIIGFSEERQASNVIEALKAKLAPTSKVRRDGTWVTLPSRELVPGDVIHVKLGDIVPADARLFSGDNVEVDESSLTGESLPVALQHGDAIHSSSIISRGSGDAVVYCTGENTSFGRAAKLAKGARPISHFQKAIVKIGDYLILLAIAMILLIIIDATLRHNPFLTTLEFCLILLVAGIPVAMPTVLSVTMAIGARELAKKHAVVSRLVSIEELAGMDILCSDKTGTLTQNKLTVGTPFCANGTTPDQLMLYAALSTSPNDGGAIEKAILDTVPDKTLLGHYKLLKFRPFDSVTKHSESDVVSDDGQKFSVALGAPQVVLGICKADGQFHQEIDDFAAHGFRSVGVAATGTDGTWRFCGLIPLFDPLRPRVTETVADAADMGVHVKMITGDHIAIARETARNLGLTADIVDAATLKHTQRDDPRGMLDLVEHADGFAQVLPEQKYAVLDTLQKGGHIVGMTGDGVNDAPALKQADCGIAVSGATEAARAAASIVLLAPGLDVIIDAIKQSRMIFQRMTNYAIYRIAETIRVLLFMTLSILVFNFYPVTAVMIVLLALMNDGAILSIAYDNVQYDNEPEAWDMKRILTIATVLGVLGVISTFLLFFLCERVFHLDPATTRTLIYLKLSVAGHFTVFAARTKGPFWSIKPAKVLVFAIVGTQIIATLTAVYGLFMTPIGWGCALCIWAYAIVWFLFNDRVKLLAYRFLLKQ